MFLLIIQFVAHHVMFVICVCFVW